MKAEKQTIVTKVTLELSEKEAKMLYILVGAISAQEAFSKTQENLRTYYRKGWVKDDLDISQLSADDWNIPFLGAIYKTLGETLDLKTD